MQKPVLFIFLLFQFNIAYLQDWNSASIPPALRINAAVVKRFESMELDIKDPSLLSLHIHQVYTILNEEGAYRLNFREYTTKYSKLKEVEIRYFDSTGKLKEKFRKKDLKVVSYGEGLIEDGETNYLLMSTDSYPVTVEMDYQIERTATLSIPAYFIQSFQESVEHSIFVARVPEEIGFRYLAKKTTFKPIISKEAGSSVYKWQAENLPAQPYEDGAASLEDCVPRIQFALNRFSFYNKDGDMSSWRNFGAWLRDLYKGLDELNPETRDQILKLVSDKQNDADKARAIYEYLQRNFRYVSIQLGIGGFQPFSAIFTQEKKYGDCKALSNYMKAALKVAGIKSYVGIINAGYNNEPVDPAFPINDFNHVILCIPQQKDSIWLECTSSSSPFGVLGSFTENRYALLITDQGGELVTTPKSNAADNKWNSNSEIRMDMDGPNKIKTIIRTSGSYKALMETIYKEKRDEQKELIVQKLGFKLPDDFEFLLPVIGEMQTDTLNMQVEKVYEFKAGSKYFLPISWIKVWQFRLPSSENRKLDFYFHEPFESRDSSTYFLPASFHAEVLPTPKKISCEFASYSSKYWFDEKKQAVCSSFELILNKHRIPAEKYTILRAFFDEVVADASQRIIVKEE